MDNKRYILEKCYLFNNKTPEEIEKLLNNTSFTTRVFLKNEIIFSPIQSADSIGIILSGDVDIQKLFPMGKSIIIERKGKGDIIGEASIFSFIDSYPDTIIACNSCEILLLPKKELHKLFKADYNIMLNFLEQISNTGLFLRHRLGLLSLDSIREKISGYILHEYNMTGANIITLPFSKKEWAEYLDISRTSLSRELNFLESDGIIRSHNRTIEIKNLDMLKNILSWI